MSTLPLRQIVRAYDHGETDKIVHNLALLNFHEIAELLDKVSKHKAELFRLLTPEQQSKVALLLHKKTKRAIFPKLTGKQIAAFIHLVDEHDSAGILRYVSIGKQEEVLSSLHRYRKQTIEKHLSYHPMLAGGMMDTNFLFVKADFTAQDVKRKVERHTNFLNKSPLIVTVEDNGKVLGYVPYRHLVLSHTHVFVKTLSIPLPLVSASTRQRDIVRTFSKHHCEVVGVFDEHGILVGIIHVKDLIFLLDRETPGGPLGHVLRILQDYFTLHGGIFWG